MLPEPPAAALRLAVDTGALQSNWRALNRLSGSARAGAAVKADAYGVGAAIAVPALLAAGCRDFFVAHWSEAAEVRSLAGYAALSVLHGVRGGDEAAYARAMNVRPVINSIAQARIWQGSGGGPCDLMVDTGMNRLGVALADLADPVIASLDIETLLSHLVSAEEDVALNAAQQSRWKDACGQLPHRRASLANSAGIALGADYHGDLTRPGIALYGGVPRPEMVGLIRQVVRPQACVLQVRDVAAGDTIGYNATYIAPMPMRVGTIALGYADGYLRCWSGKGVMDLGGRHLPVLGRVSMDLTVVDLTNAPETQEGDWLEADYLLPEASAVTGLSQYELLTLLGRRFSRKSQQLK